MGWKADQLIKQHGNACFLCGLRMDTSVRSGPLSPTVEHLVPTSKGGDNRGRNLRPSHALCNGLRGSKDITDDLRLSLRKEVAELLALQDQDESWDEVDFPKLPALRLDHIIPRPGPPTKQELRYLARKALRERLRGTWPGRKLGECPGWAGILD